MSCFWDESVPHALGLLVAVLMAPTAEGPGLAVRSSACSEGSGGVHPTEETGKHTEGSQGVRLSLGMCCR